MIYWQHCIRELRFMVRMPLTAHISMLMLLGSIMRHSTRRLI